VASRIPLALAFFKHAGVGSASVVYSSNVAKRQIVNKGIDEGEIEIPSSIYRLPHKRF
jgi:hypothetical protein